MKLIALNWRFFKIPWNIFDIAIVVLSLMGKIILRLTIINDSKAFFDC
jgi:hypothetical protein